MASRGSMQNLLREIGDILNTPIPGLGFLEMTIPLPQLPKFKARPTRGQKVVAKPGNFQLMGELHEGKNTKYAVAGQDFFLNNNTWIVGALTIGSKAKVRGVTIKGGRKVATRILVETFEKR